MSMAFCTRCGVAVDAQLEGKCPTCSILLDEDLATTRGRAGEGKDARIASLEDLDLSQLCVTCERKVRQDRVHRLEEFCFRCWDRVAPLMLEETEALY